MVTILGSSSIKFYKHVKFSASFGVAFISVMPFLLISYSNAITNTYQRNKQDFSYRNGCAKEISKEIKDRKNKK
jgi:arginine exporter protein ArgO